MKNSLIDWLSSADIAEKFRWTRQQVSITARREKWRTVEVGNAYLYNRDDVEGYDLARHRSELQRRLGVVFRGLVRDNRYDITCPVCGAYAVFQMPGDPEQKQAWEQFLSGERTHWPWACENEHDHLSVSEQAKHRP